MKRLVIFIAFVIAMLCGMNAMAPGLLSFTKRDGEQQRHRDAIVLALRAALSDTEVLTDTVVLSQVKEAFDGTSHRALGYILGYPDSDGLLTREWPYVAGLERLCRTPDPQCWRVQDINVDYHDVYPPRPLQLLAPVPELAPAEPTNVKVSTPDPAPVPSEPPPITDGWTPVP